MSNYHFLILNFQFLIYLCAMAQEIERNFLVIGEFKSSAFAQSHIVLAGVLSGFVFGMIKVI